MDNDDLPIGRLLSRREVVRLLALSGAGALVGCNGKGANAGSTAESQSGMAAGAAGSAPIPGCVVRPELTVGPYFVDKQLERSDIRAEPSTAATKEGAPLVLAFNVSQLRDGQCTPLPGAMVDVWQCDANGAYSGVTDRMVGFDTVGQKYLRGYQVTDDRGVARFMTIYPGWYQGRTVHIHFKVRTPATAALADRTAETYEFTSQLFFDDALTDRVFAQEPYRRKGPRDTKNANDGIYREVGSQLVLAVGEESAGYSASFDIGLDLSDTRVGQPERSGGRRGRRPGGSGS